MRLASAAVVLLLSTPPPPGCASNTEKKVTLADIEQAAFKKTEGSWDRLRLVRGREKF